MRGKCKRITALLLTAALLAACGAEKGGTSVLKEGQSDIAYVQEKGTFVVGITDFAPMDYKEGEEWVGFDADMAKAFAEKMGVKAEFREIEWDDKTELLEDGTIDCIWNGMTETEELKKTISCSRPYLSNNQVFVMPDDTRQTYKTPEECQHLLFAVESGSTGETLLREKKYRYTAYETQKEALQSVCDRQTDAAVIDIVMAAYYTEKEEGFQNLNYQFSLNDEKICVGLRKGSDMTEKVNDFFAESLKDGTVQETAKRYGIEDAVIA